MIENDLEELRRSLTVSRRNEPLPEPQPLPTTPFGELIWELQLKEDAQCLHRQR